MSCSTNDASTIGYLQETKSDFFLTEDTQKYILNMKIQKAKLEFLEGTYACIPVILLLGVYPRENFVHVFKKRYKNVYCSIFLTKKLETSFGSSYQMYESWKHPI